MFRILAVLSCLLVTACTGSAYQLPAVSSAEVKEMEQKVAKDIKPLKKYNRTDAHYKKTLTNITARLTRNAKPLCEHSGYDRCHFQVTYNPSSTTNAYASDGYKITIFKGLLQYLKNDDEVAAVIAHEMGHHLAKHNEEKARNAAAGAALSGVLTAVLIGAANANNPYYSAYQQRQDQQTMQNMMNLGAHVGMMSYSKEQEREADLLATYLLSRSGYDLRKAQNVMIVLAQFAGETDPSRSAFLDSHPAGMERVVAWEKAMQEIKGNKSKLPYLKEVSKKAAD